MFPYSSSNVTWLSGGNDLKRMKMGPNPNPGMLRGTTFPDSHAGNGSTSSSNRELTSTYNVRPYTLIEEESRSLKMWTHNLLPGTLVFVRSASLNDNNSINTKINSYSEVVDMLSSSQLNYQLHAMTYLKLNEIYPNYQGNPAMFHAKMLDILEEMFIWANTWTPAGVLMTTPMEGVTYKNIDQTRRVVVLQKGVANVENLWETNIKTIDTCYIRLSAQMQLVQTPATYIVGESEHVVVNAFPKPYYYPCFQSITSENGAPLDPILHETFPVSDEPLGAVPDPRKYEPLHYARVFTLGTCFYGRPEYRLPVRSKGPFPAKSLNKYQKLDINAQIQVLMNL